MWCGCCVLWLQKAQGNPFVLQKVSPSLAAWSLKDILAVKPLPWELSWAAEGSDREFAFSWKQSLSFRENQMGIMVKSDPDLWSGGINFLSSGTETWVIPNWRVPCPSSGSSLQRVTHGCCCSSSGCAHLCRAHVLPRGQSCAARHYQRRGFQEEAVWCNSSSGAKAWDSQTLICDSFY